MSSLTTQTKHVSGIILMLASVPLSVANPPPFAAMSSADVPAGNSLGSARLSQPDQATQGRVFQDYGKLPLSFEANQGQTDSPVKFLLRGNDYTLFLTPTEAVLTLRNAEHMTNGRARPRRNDEFKNPHSSVIAHQSSFNAGTVLRMKLVGANPRPQRVLARAEPELRKVREPGEMLAQGQLCGSEPRHGNRFQFRAQVHPFRRRDLR